MCRPPLISPAGSVSVRVSGKALISWEKSRTLEMRPQDDDCHIKYTSIFIEILQDSMAYLQHTIKMIWMTGELMMIFAALVHENDISIH